MLKKYGGVLFHSLLEGLLIVALVWAGRIADSYPQWFGWNKDWLEFAAVIILFLAIFFWHAIQGTRQVRFESVGSIKGPWLDAIYDGGGKLVMGSFVREMKCSELDGFTVNGSSYFVRVEGDGTVKVDNQQDNPFSGKGAYWEPKQICFYHYSGREGKGHDGAGYYRFEHGDRGKAFVGGFLFPGIETDCVIDARHVIGTKLIGKKRKDYRTKQQQIAILEEYLSQSEKQIRFS